MPEAKLSPFTDYTSDDLKAFEKNMWIQIIHQMVAGEAGSFEGALTGEFQCKAFFFFPPQEKIWNFEAKTLFFFFVVSCRQSLDKLRETSVVIIRVDTA